MSFTSRIAHAEWSRFAALGLLLFINAIVSQSNNVVATSGFIANVGVRQMVIVWALDNFIILCGSGLYSVYVDRMKRTSLLLYLYLGATFIYVLLYVLFITQMPSFITFSLLMVVNDQQWIVFAIAVWALASDIFSVSEGQRLFPLLGTVALVGGIVGNNLPAVTAFFSNKSAAGSATPFGLMLFNAALMAGAVILLTTFLRKLKVEVHQSQESGSVVEMIREGYVFVKEIPAFRYLALIMLVVGIGLNTMEYQLSLTGATAFPTERAFSEFYGLFKTIRMASIFFIQAFVSTKLLQNAGYKSIFSMLPSVMLVGLVASIFFPVIYVVAAGDYFMRVVMEGLDDPARRSFIGLVPDERRGRVSAFFNGYLYPLGAVISCGIIGIAFLLEDRGILTAITAQRVYLGIVAAIVASALYFIVRLQATYDESMLNWRLRRRRRSSQLANLDL